MTIYAVTGWQSYETPHWHVAYVEADSEEAARTALLRTLETNDRDTVWGWDGDAEGHDYQDPANWTVTEAERPFRFVLGGGCR